MEAAAPWSDAAPPPLAGPWRFEIAAGFLANIGELWSKTDGFEVGPLIGIQVDQGLYN